MIKQLLQSWTSPFIVKFGGIRFPMESLDVLLAQSTSAEVVRGFQKKEAKCLMVVCRGSKELS